MPVQKRATTAVTTGMHPSSGQRNTHFKQLLRRDLCPELEEALRSERPEMSESQVSGNVRI